MKSENIGTRIKYKGNNKERDIEYKINLKKYRSEAFPRLNQYKNYFMDSKNDLSYSFNIFINDSIMDAKIKNRKIRDGD